MLPKEMKVKPTESTKSQYKVVKECLRGAEHVIIATDIDREGENIARSIMDYAKCKPKKISRLWINSLDKSAVREGFQNLKDGKETELWYEEAQARQCADWLVGMNASQLYSLVIQANGGGGSFSLGRVQTPTLYAIREREIEIENFVEEKFYTNALDCISENVRFVTKNGTRFKTEEQAKAVLPDGVSAVVKVVESELKKQESPKLFSLSTLQEKANKLWKYSPNDTLKIVQSLYETHKILTYPRTSCQFITDKEFSYLCENVEDYKKILGGEEQFESVNNAPRKRFVDNAKVVEHYAIIPTNNANVDLSMLSDKERNVYLLVLRTTLAMFAPTHEYDQTTVTVCYGDVDFTCTGKCTVENGWKLLFNAYGKEKSDKEVISLPALTEGQVIDATPVTKDGKTEPPKRYSEGDLINVMKFAGKLIEDESEREMLTKVKGIGTEATRATVIEKLKSTEYITIDKNKVYVTPKGVFLCSLIKGTKLSSASMTANWEESLGNISAGTNTKEKFLAEIHDYITELVKNVKVQKVDTSSVPAVPQGTKQSSEVGKCPACGGAVVEREKGFSCSKYRETGCNFIIWKKIAGKSISVSNATKLLKEGKTPKIKGFKGSKGPYDAVLILKSDNTVGFDFNKK